MSYSNQQNCEWESHVWCLFSEGRTLSNPRKLRSVEVWTMSPLPSERAGSSHQLSNFYPLKQNIMEKTTGSTNQRQWARDKHLDLSRVMSLELGVVKWGGFCLIDTNASRQWKGQWYESMQGNISWCWCSWQAGVLCCHCGTWRTSVIPQQQKQNLSVCIQFPLTFLHQLHILRKTIELDQPWP